MTEGLRYIVASVPDKIGNTIGLDAADQILNLLKGELEGLTVIEDEEINKAIDGGSANISYYATLRDGQGEMESDIYEICEVAIKRQLSHTIKELKAKLGG